MNALPIRMRMDDFSPGGPLPETRDDLRKQRREAVERQIRETEETIQLERAIEAAKRGDGTSWVSLFANMLVSGSPIEQCAVRLGRPRHLLEQLLNEEFFKTMLDQIAAEGKANVGLALLKGSTVDNIYTMLKLRDAPTTKPELRFKIAAYLLDRTEGIRKEGFGGQLGHGFLDSAVEGGIDQHTIKEIERHLAAHPEIGALARKARALKTADAPEAVQECVGEGQDSDAGGVVSSAACQENSEQFAAVGVCPGQSGLANH